MKKFVTRIRTFIADCIYKLKSRARFKKKLKEIRERDPYIYK